MPAPGDRYDGDSSSTEDDESVRAYAYAQNGEASNRSHYSYNNLFKLEPLLNFRLPQGADSHHSSTSSQDPTDSGRGIRRLHGYVNGSVAERPSDIQSEMTMKRKRVQVEADAGRNSARRDDSGSNDEDEDITISEEHYRFMLSDHLQKHKRTRLLESINARTSAQGSRKRDRSKPKAAIMPAAERVDANGIDVSNQQENAAGLVKQYTRKHRVRKSDQDVVGPLPGSELQQSTVPEHFSAPGIPPPPGLLDLNGHVPYQIPPLYDQLPPPMQVPDFAVMETQDANLGANMNSTSIMPMIAPDPRADLWNLRAGMGPRYDEGPPQPVMGMPFRLYEEDGQRHFPPQQVFDMGTMPGFLADGSSGPGLIPVGPGPVPDQGAFLGRPGEEAIEESRVLEVIDLNQDGSTMRHISSEEGLMRHCEVKVVEQGEGYEIIQRKVQKEVTKRDPAVVAKEDIDKVGRHWAALVRKDLPKHHKQFMAFHKRQFQDIKRFAEFCQREVKIRNIRSLKLLRSAPIRTRRLARDMVIFWRKVDKEQAEVRKKEERDAADALKREEELREAKRQQQRLNFLLTQTELYSHFMQSKKAGAANATDSASDPAADPSTAPSTAAEAEEEEALKEEALRVATKAANQQRNKTNAFDSETSKLRHAAIVQGSEQEEVDPADAVDDIDLLNPSTMPATSSVQQPKLFQGSLKDYQLKGLQWLVNCYEQGLNGILADEMGLGKTVQAMAFLAHLAEEKNIWGPFLVVAPASVLNNWADEVGRFCSHLKILPYWGGLNERTVLRKNINPKRLYKRDAVFHVLITSYQLLVSDEKYFRRVKWQYMILDEAQAIKSASSLRWRTLLSFNCRNRLLLTGTPIQNSMAELWALLHFIMPTLFDSHEQFSEWFSKGIESHAEHGGTLNEHQLTRLHAILKPFMLRRVKRDVITEMTNKKEVMVSCILSKRQQAFYQALKNKISVADLFDSKGAMNEKKVLNLMNIVIQLRKVCNHPELFERNEGHSFLQFAYIANALLPANFGEPDYIHYSGAWNPISYRVPKLLFRDGMHCLPSSNSGSCQGFYEKWVRKRLSIYSADHVQDSIFAKKESDRPGGTFSDSGFGFTRLLDLSPSEVEFLANASTQERWLYAVLHADVPWVTDFFDRRQVIAPPDEDEDEDESTTTRAVKRLLILPSRSEATLLHKKHPTGPASEPSEALVTTSNERFLMNVALLRAVRSYMPAVQAPQIDLMCSDRGLAYQRTEELQNPSIHRLLVGFGRTSTRNGPGLPRPAHPLIREVDVQLRVEEPLLSLPYQIYGSAPPVQSFDFAKMLTDSGKLHTLDGLLKRLRAENHRVLLFAQMTKMLNILEDYMNYRKYKYLRLDGSSTIMDRRDMVKDFQRRGDIFVFLLSTRAGGLGINLTAADTVVFYESDWNPTMDLQAMDRAHRLGQTKEVTVYRMICKGTVEEKILKRASQKNTVQQLVMTGGQSSQGDVFQADEVVSLLLDDAELEQRLKEQKGSKQTEKGEKRRKGWAGGSNVKGVRLDAEGGGASLDEEAAAGVSNGDKAVPPGGEKDSAGGENAKSGTAAVATQSAGGKKRRRGEGRAPRPPKAPKPPKELKPPKEPKAPKEPRVRRDRKQPRIPRPRRDPRLPRARGRPKAKSEKSSAATAAGDSSTGAAAAAPLSETPPTASAVAAGGGGIDEPQVADAQLANGDGPPADMSPGATDAGNDAAAPDLTSNGDVVSVAQNLAAASPEIDAAPESELPVGGQPSSSNNNNDPDGEKEGDKTPSNGEGAAVVGKSRARPPPTKRARKTPSDPEAENGTPQNHTSSATAKISSSSPSRVGTLKLSLNKPPPPSVDSAAGAPVPQTGDSP